MKSIFFEIFNFSLIEKLIYILHANNIIVVENYNFVNGGVQMEEQPLF